MKKKYHCLIKIKNYFLKKVILLDDSDIKFSCLQIKKISSDVPNKFWTLK